MKNSLLRMIASAVVLLAMDFSVQCVFAQGEIAPPRGNGHVVVFVSGIAGPKHDKALSEAIAAFGYDVYVCDGREIAKMPGANLRAAIAAAQKMPHALPGRVALVGVSLGGGFSLALGSEWSDLVAVDIVWYPATGFAVRLPGFVRRISVPVLMFAGESDHFENCCLIETARAINASAKRSNVPFELVTYPGADHDFIKGGKNYNPAAYQDAMERTAAKLKTAFAGE
jgi:dienelactone hydrolase